MQKYYPEGNSFVVSLLEEKLLSVQHFLMSKEMKSAVIARCPKLSFLDALRNFQIALTEQNP